MLLILLHLAHIIHVRVLGVKVRPVALHVHITGGCRCVPWKSFAASVPVPLCCVPSAIVAVERVVPMRSVSCAAAAHDGGRRASSVSVMSGCVLDVAALLLLPPRGEPGMSSSGDPCKGLSPRRRWCPWTLARQVESPPRGPRTAAATVLDGHAVTLCHAQAVALGGEVLPL